MNCCFKCNALLSHHAVVTEVRTATEQPSEKLQQQPIKNHSCKCSARHWVFVCLVVVVSLSFVGGGILWHYGSQAPGQSAVNQGAGKGLKHLAVLCKVFSCRLCLNGNGNGNVSRCSV